MHGDRLRATSIRVALPVDGSVQHLRRRLDLVVQHDVVRWLRGPLQAEVALHEPVVGARVGDVAVDHDAGEEVAFAVVVDVVLREEARGGALDDADEQEFWRGCFRCVVGLGDCLLDLRELVLGDGAEFAFGDAVTVEDDLRWEGAVVLGGPVRETLAHHFAELFDHFRACGLAADGCWVLRELLVFTGDDGGDAWCFSHGSLAHMCHICAHDHCCLG